MMHPHLQSMPQTASLCCCLRHTENSTCSSGLPATLPLPHHSLTVSQTPPLVSEPHHSQQTLSAVDGESHTERSFKEGGRPELEVAGLLLLADQT